MMRVFRRRPTPVRVVIDDILVRCWLAKIRNTA